MVASQIVFHVATLFGGLCKPLPSSATDIVSLIGLAGTVDQTGSITPSIIGATLALVIVPVVPGEPLPVVQPGVGDIKVERGVLVADQTELAVAFTASTL